MSAFGFVGFILFLWIELAVKEDNISFFSPCVLHYASGAMPDKAGPIDPTWAANLEATIQAFAEQGVYVFLEAMGGTVARETM